MTHPHIGDLCTYSKEWGWSTFTDIRMLMRTAVAARRCTYADVCGDGWVCVSQTGPLHTYSQMWAFGVKRGLALSDGSHQPWSLTLPSSPRSPASEQLIKIPSATSFGPGRRQITQPLSLHGNPSSNNHDQNPSQSSLALRPLQVCEREAWPALPETSTS